MHKMMSRTALGALSLTFATEAVAVEWNVSLWGKRRAFTEHVEKLAELVEEKTGGEFTMNISYGGLSKNTENLDGIEIGAFEMAQFCAGYHRDKNPTITVLELPFLGVETLEQEREISMALYEHPAVQEDLARWNATLLMPSPMPQYNVVGQGEMPETLSDFKGLPVRATGGIGVAMEELGAVPTSMSATEVRQALDSGVIKGASFAPHAHMSFGTVENADWWTSNLNPGTVNCPVVANSDAFESLSEEHRAALMDSIPEALDYYVENYQTNTLERWPGVLEEKGIDTISFDETELAEFRDATAIPAAEAWIAENAERGIPAQELYDMVKGMIDGGS